MTVTFFLGHPVQYWFHGKSLYSFFNLISNSSSYCCVLLTYWFLKWRSIMISYIHQPTYSLCWHMSFVVFHKSVWCLSVFLCRVLFFHFLLLMSPGHDVYHPFIIFLYSFISSFDWTTLRGLLGLEGYIKSLIHSFIHSFTIQSLTLSFILFPLFFFHLFDIP